jgi:hypothetical protein
MAASVSTSKKPMYSGRASQPPTCDGFDATAGLHGVRACGLHWLNPLTLITCLPIYTMHMELATSIA